MNTTHDILVHDLLADSARRHPNRAALRSPTWQLTYGDVHARTNALAHALVGRGVRRGNAVLVLGRGSVQTILALWSALKANAVAVVVPPGTPPDLLDAAVGAWDARVMVSEARLMSSLTPLTGRARGLEHILLCGAVGRDELPPIPGAECAAVAMEGQVRRVPPVPESLATDVALVTVDASGVRARTHREILRALDRERATDETHEGGLLGTAEGIERMLRITRDGATLRLVPRPRPGAPPPLYVPARTP